MLLLLLLLLNLMQFLFHACLLLLLFLFVFCLLSLGGLSRGVRTLDQANQDLEKGDLPNATVPLRH